MRANCRWKFGGNVKTSTLLTLAFVILLCATALAQAAQTAQISSHPRHRRVIRMTGKITADGTRFVEATSQKIWMIKNVEMCQGYQAQQTIVRAETETDKSTMQIISISAQPAYTANWSGSAFRR